MKQDENGRNRFALLKIALASISAKQ